MNKRCVNDPEAIGMFFILMLFCLFKEYWFLAGMAFSPCLMLCFCWIWENLIEKKPEDYKDLKGG